MVETRHILPPDAGPTSDPVLFGVADALATLFPIDERHFPRPCPTRVTDPVARPEPPAASAPAGEPEIVTA